MIWFTLILFVVSFIATALLSPKPEIEDQRPNTLEDLNFPQAADGMPVALILGQVRLKAPNTLWFGDFTSSAITEKVKTGIFTSKTIIKGFKYFVGFDLGLCLGPGVHLRRIWLDKDEVWSGDVGPSPTALTIDKPNLFGGDDKGGGFVGTARFYGGEVTQAENAYIAALVTTYTTYGSVAHIVFEQPYIGNATSLKAPSFELERFTDHLGLLAAEKIITTPAAPGNPTPDGKDINPMEALYEVLTSDWGGLGMSTSDIDLPSFKSAAETLAAEGNGSGNGISFLLTKNSNGKKAMTEILRQVDGILFQNPETGKIQAKLIRLDYVLSSTPIFNEKSIAKVKKFSRTSWDDTINQIRVTFQNRHNVDSAYVDATAIDQDMANVNTQGKLKTKTISFPLCKEPIVAVDLATRERTQLGVPLYNLETELDRTAAVLLPGDVFRFSWAEYNIVEAVFRVQKFDQGSLDKGKVVLSAIQDTFAVATTVYGVPEDTLNDPIDFAAATIVDVGMQEAPFWLMQQQEELPIPPSATSRGFVLCLCRPVNTQQQGYTCKLTQDTFVTTILGVDHLLYPPTAGLTANMLSTDGFVDGLITTVDVTLTGGDAHTFLSVTAAQIRAEGRNLFFIGDELFAFESATDQGGGVWRLANVHRALLETKFDAHTAGDPVYFLSDLDSLALSEFDSTVTVTARFMSFTSKDESEFDDMTNKTRTMNRRYERVLPPDYIQVATVRSTSQSIADTAAPFTIDWKERSRDDTSIRFENDATQTPETNQVYDVKLFVGGIERDSSLGVTGTTTTVDSLGNTGDAYIEITAKDSVNSLTGFNVARYDFTVT